MAEKHAVKDVKIGRPKVRGLDLLRDPLLNKVCLYLYFTLNLLNINWSK